MPEYENHEVCGIPLQKVDHHDFFFSRFRITKKIKILRITGKNYENSEKLNNQLQNYENNEIHRIPFQSNENHENS